MHPFDRFLFRRSLAWALAAAAGAAVIVSLTDEPFSTLGMRMARLAAFAPGFAVIAIAVALAQARQRGELRALAALGASPWRLSRGATLAGWVIGGAAVAALASPWSDKSALFPAMSAPGSWSALGPSLLESTQGVLVAPNGELVLFASGSAQVALPQPGALAAVLAIGPLAFAAPPWVSARLSTWSRVLGTLLTFILSIVLLHAVAVGANQALLLLAGLPLTAQAAVGHFLREGGRLG